jgi:hypothetical protein
MSLQEFLNDVIGADSHCDDIKYLKNRLAEIIDQYSLTANPIKIEERNLDTKKNGNERI